MLDASPSGPAVAAVGAAGGAAACKAAEGMTKQVVFYTTSTAATTKLKADVARVKQLLDAKGAIYEEARAARGSTCPFFYSLLFLFLPYPYFQISWK